jgi:xanthine dehydrogenase accessory factor
MTYEREFLELIQECREKGGQITLLHVFSGSKEVGKLSIQGDSLVSMGALDHGLSKLLQDEMRRRVGTLSSKRADEFSLGYVGSGLHIVVEVIESAPWLFVFGAGHVGQSVAMIGSLAGYRVVVVDDRIEFLTRARFPNDNIDVVAGKYEKVISEISIPRNSAVVIVTRGHQFDEICLKQVLSLETRYVGMIGSRRRVLSIFAKLRDSGISQGALEKVHAPIGLEIGAVSPQEIAVAIMAEIISVMNGFSPDKKTERRLL